ncbi:MAG: outer membrane protein assembly factor BamA [Bilophila sp.]
MKKCVFALLTLTLCSFVTLVQGTFTPVAAASARAQGAIPASAIAPPRADQLEKPAPAKVRQAPPKARDAEAVRVVILPFQVNGGKDLDYLNDELPALFAQRLAAKGFQVVPYKDSLRLLKQQDVKQLNVAAARAIASQTRAGYAVYGSFNKTGEAFSIDARMVDAAGRNPARPYFVEKKNLIQLLPAVEELVSNMSGSVVKRNAIADIRVRGLKVLDQDVVLMRLNTRKGDAIDPSTVNDEIKRIWDLGYFSDVTADLEQSGEGQLLVFTVKEKPRIDDVVVNGSDAVKKDDIMAAMSSKTGSVLNERLLAGDIQKITELYRKEGYYLAEVTSRIEQKTNSASALLVFDVKEGNKLYIKDIKFEGLESISASDLKKQLALEEHGVLSWLTGTGVLREEYLERDSAAITAYAMNNGYADIQVAAPQVAYQDDGIEITFAVKEGKRYKLGNIGFKGDLIDTDARLFEVIKTDNHKEDAEYFSLSVIQDDVKALTDFYSNYGYAFAEVDLDSQKNEAEGLIDINFVLNKKQKVHVRRVIAEGNTRTRDNVIFRELRLADGDPFDGEKLRRSNERLNRLRFFTQADTTILPTDKEDEVDLRVNIKEDRTGALMGGVGYSTFYQFGVTGSIMERNLFGRGYLLGLTGFVSGKSTSLDLTFTNPRLFDTDLGFTDNAYAIWEEWDDFQKKTIGNTMRLFHPIGEYTSVSLGYRLDRYTLFDIPEYASRAYKEYEGQNLSSVVSAGIGYDSTDSRERPTKGVNSRLFMEYGGGGIGGNDNFYKPIVEMQSFHTLLRNPNHIFHWRTRLGGVFENSDKPVPVFDRFFIGGMESIRGYDSDDLSPRDPKYHDQIGGDRMGYLNIEYIWTFHPELGLAVVPFFDMGFNVDSKQTNDPLGELKKSVGLELRWRSPMGDLRFAYGYPLDKNVKGDRPGGRFEFSMGQFF